MTAKLAYLALLLAFIFAPQILFPLLTRQKIYDSLSYTSKNSRNFAYTRRLIFDEVGDIDILIAGNSQIGFGLAPKILERAVAADVHRPAAVRTIAYNWSREDLLYAMLLDLLPRRKVKLLLLGPILEGREANLHPGLYELWTSTGYFSDPILDEFPESEALSYRATRSYDWPRKLVTLLRQDRREPALTAPDTDPNYGNYKLIGWLKSGAPYSDFDPPQKPPLAPQELLFSSESANRFKILDTVKGPFLDKVVSLCDRYGVQIAFLNMPKRKIENVTLADRKYFGYGRQSKFVMGVPTAFLFKGYTESDIDKLYGDPMHLNTNGRRFFTEAILPTLRGVYEKSTLAR